MDFTFSPAEEIARELGSRLKSARLALGLAQSELAARAGVARGTIATLENSGQSSLASMVQVVQALGLASELQNLFVPQPASIAAMERQAQARARQRAPRRRPIPAP